MNKNNRRNKRFKKELHRINHRIFAKSVRIVGDNVENGIYSKEEALKLADIRELDLVEISPTANPPVCKIMDYNKFLYDKKKKDKEKQKMNKKVQMKELRFSPTTGIADIEHKKSKAEEFLKEDLKVKLIVKFKGRMITHSEKGELLLLQFADDLSDIAIPENMPKLEGKSMTMILKPNKKSPK